MESCRFAAAFANLLYRSRASCTWVHGSHPSHCLRRSRTSFWSVTWPWNRKQWQKSLPGAQSEFRRSFKPLPGRRMREREEEMVAGKVSSRKMRTRYHADDVGSARSVYAYPHPRMR